MAAFNDAANDVFASGPTLGVAFGSGGARGLAHIHVIEAFDELGIRPSAITGSSIGAIFGAAMASGMSGIEIREHTLSAVGSQRQILARFWRSRPPSMKEIVTGGLRFGQFNLERLLKGFLPTETPDDFSDLHIPFQAVATDFYSGEEIVIDSGRIIEALAASAAIPAVFRPVMKNGRVLVDGGMVNPVPYDLLKLRADAVVAVDVTGMPEGDGSAVPSSAEAIYGASQLLQRALLSAKLHVHAPAVLLRPRVGMYRTLDFMKAREILASTAQLKDEAKYAIASVVERLEFAA